MGAITIQAKATSPCSSERCGNIAKIGTVERESIDNSEDRAEKGGSCGNSTNYSQSKYVGPEQYSDSYM